MHKDSPQKESTEESLEALAQRTAQALLSTSMVLVTAESCTGGWVAKLITDIAGSSAWFDRGFVTYTNQSKQEMVSVSPDSLKQYGAVSEQVVAEMVAGALANSQATIALAISGIAGPTGGSDEKPVGTVCFAWQKRGESSYTETQFLSGNRDAVREQAVRYSLQKIINDCQ